MKCKLSLIIEGMDRVNIEEKCYLNENNGRVFVSTNMGNFYIDNAEILKDEVLDNDVFIPLPDQYEIDEYKIMEDFIDTVKDSQIKNQLFIVIHGRGAFRRFKDSSINYGMIDDWYKFKNNAYYNLAKEWCIWNNIDFDDDVVIKL